VLHRGLKRRAAPLQALSHEARASQWSRSLRSADLRDFSVRQQSPLPLAEASFAADVRLMAWCTPAGSTCERPPSRKDKNSAMLPLLTRRVPGGQGRLSESTTGQIDSAVQHRQGWCPWVGARWSSVILQIAESKSRIQGTAPSGQGKICFGHLHRIQNTE